MIRNDIFIIIIINELLMSANNANAVQTMQCKMPFHFSLKALKFARILILTGRAFQISGQQNLRFIVPNVTWFLLGIFNFNLYLSLVTRISFLISNISFMKLGFKLLSVLCVSMQWSLIRRMFILHLPDFSNNCSYELT